MSKLVYIAGPYTNPDPVVNTHEAIKLADDIYEWSNHFLVPVIPHLSMLWHAVCPHADIDFWYNYDLELLARCDALYRMLGLSTGADGEVQKAIRLQMPVFYTRQALGLWAESWRH